MCRLILRSLALETIAAPSRERMAGRRTATDRILLVVAKATWTPAVMTSLGAYARVCGPDVAVRGQSGVKKDAHKGGIKRVQQKSCWAGDRGD
jgi:hypothetical protein